MVSGIRDPHVSSITSCHFWSLPRCPKSVLSMTGVLSPGLILTPLGDSGLPSAACLQHDWKAHFDKFSTYHTDPYGSIRYLHVSPDSIPFTPKKIPKGPWPAKKKHCVNDAGIPGIHRHPMSSMHQASIHVPSMYPPSFIATFVCVRLRPSCRLVTELCNSALCICQILSINSLPGQDRDVSVGQESNDSIGNKLSVRVSVKLRCH